MTKALRLGFVDVFDGVQDYFVDLLRPKYEITLDNANPQVLIFGDENFGNDNTNYDPSKVFKLFYTGENRRYWNYACHAACTFDHIDTNQHFRIPLYMLNMHYHLKKFGLMWEDEWNNRQNNFDIEEFKSRQFCGYVQSNPSQVKRNEMFTKISELFGQVRSGGPHLNNIGYVIPRGEDGIEQKMNFLREHQFTLAFENSQYPGYATEKLIEAYLSGTIPLYWGSPTVEFDFNFAGFINWHAAKSDQGFLDYIAMVFTDDKFMELKMKQPLFTVRQVANMSKLPEQFRIWFDANVYKQL